MYITQTSSKNTSILLKKCIKILMSNETALNYTNNANPVNVEYLKYHLFYEKLCNQYQIFSYTKVNSLKCVYLE